MREKQRQLHGSIKVVGWGWNPFQLQTRSMLLEEHRPKHQKLLIWDPGTYAFKMSPRRSWCGARTTAHKSRLMLMSLSTGKWQRF